MKQKLSQDFLETLAEHRAKELFTREFFETCTDSWYGDEFFRLKGEVTFNGKLLKPSDDDAYTYMGILQQYKNIYHDNYFAQENAMYQYNGIINKMHEIIDDIDEGNKRYKAFECDPEIVAKLKDIGNYFVNLYNKEYKTYKKKHKDVA